MTTFRTVELSSRSLLWSDRDSLLPATPGRGWTSQVRVPVLLLALVCLAPLEAQHPSNPSNHAAASPASRPAVSTRLDTPSPRPTRPVANHPAFSPTRPAAPVFRRQEPPTRALAYQAYVPVPQAMSAANAMAVAEEATGGVAVSARRIDLNAASGGFEVLIRMPESGRAYRVVIDADTRRVRSTYLVTNTQLTHNPRPELLVAEPGPERTARIPGQSGSPLPAGPSSATASAAPDLHVWRDSRGNLNITDFPPPDGRKELR
jgi:hypothetical protein